MLAKVASFKYFQNFKNMSIIEEFNEEQFIDIITNSKTWKEIAVKFGYQNTLASNLKLKIINKCKNLGIDPPKIKQIKYVNNQTKGDLFVNRKNWQSARSSIRKAAERIFKESKVPFKCAICGYDKHIEIAHIKAVSDFDDSTKISEINSIDNLIALCPNHHWEYDNGILKL